MSRNLVYWVAQLHFSSCPQLPRLEQSSAQSTRPVPQPLHDASVQSEATYPHLQPSQLQTYSWNAERVIEASNRTTGLVVRIEAVAESSNPLSRTSQGNNIELQIIPSRRYSGQCVTIHCDYECWNPWFRNWPITRTDRPYLFNIASTGPEGSGPYRASHRHE